MEWREEVGPASASFERFPNLDVGLGGWHVLTVVADVLGRSHTELTPDIYSEAQDPLARIDGAGHLVSRTHGKDPIIPQVHVLEGGPHLVESVTPVLGVTIAQLTRLVAAPALDPP